jgi:hypothetical protein
MMTKLKISKDGSFARMKEKGLPKRLGSLSAEKTAAIYDNVRALIRESRAADRREYGDKYDPQWRCRVNQADYAQAFGTLNCLVITGHITGRAVNIRGELGWLLATLQDGVMIEERERMK